jgi:hypothetical protein
MSVPRYSAADHFKYEDHEPDNEDMVVDLDDYRKLERKLEAVPCFPLVLRHTCENQARIWRVAEATERGNALRASINDEPSKMSYYEQQAAHWSAKAAEIESALSGVP